MCFAVGYSYMTTPQLSYWSGDRIHAHRGTDYCKESGAWQDVGIFSILSQIVNAAAVDLNDFGNITTQVHISYHINHNVSFWNTSGICEDLLDAKRVVQLTALRRYTCIQRVCNRYMISSFTRRAHTMLCARVDLIRPGGFIQSNNKEREITVM